MSDQYYPFYVGDYLRDTAVLTLVEHGAYHLLLHQYYVSKGILTSDRKELYRICRAFTQDEQMAIDTICDRYFIENGNGLLKNRKADEVIAKRNAFIAQQSEKGKRSAKKRWGNVTNVITTVNSRLQPKDNQEITNTEQILVDVELANKNNNIKHNKLNKIVTTVEPMFQPNCNLPSPSPSPSLSKIKTHIGEKVTLPDWMPEETWSIFLSHRRTIKAPITKEAHPQFIRKFEKLKEQGYDPAFVVGTMVERGWRWFKPEWVDKTVDQTGKKKRNVFLEGFDGDKNHG